MTLLGLKKLTPEVPNRSKEFHKPQHDSISLNMTLLGLKKRIPEASGPSFGAFWRPQGLVLELLRLVLIDVKIRRAARPTGVLDAKPSLGI